MTIAEQRDAFLAGSATAVDAVDTALQRIDAQTSLNAFISVFPERARIRADALDQRRNAGACGPLAGTVLGIKDLINVQGEATTCGSHILEGYTSPFDATVIERLEAADAIIVGKCNMDEFAMGSSNETSYFGPVQNPRNTDHVPGGSSGGSVAAVAADLVPAALGSDTGGSIRQPAAFCGVVGMKPTYGRISRYGLVAYASSLDQIGPITHSVHDNARLLGVIAGHDPRDSTSVDVPVPDYTASLNQDVKGLTIGVPEEYRGEGLDAEIAGRLDALLEQLQQAGANIVSCSLPHTKYCIATYYIIAPAEASSNLSRFDGVRYGYRADEGTTLSSMFVESRSQGFGPEVQRRIMLGTYVLSAGYYDAYYQKARKVRRLIKEDFDRAFTDCDCLITPVAPTTAPKFGEMMSNPLQMYLADIYTTSVNLAGLPGLSVPCGTATDNLPIGFQILGKHFDESMLYRVGHYIEQHCAPAL
jgi:aspartyl-tRNA(Asn)/glutamyl-tRNA(Gln) amidotransferase subunit A